MTGFENVGSIYTGRRQPSKTQYFDFYHPMAHPDTCPISFRIHAHGLHVGRYPPQPVSVLGPTPTLSPSFLMTQAIFKPKLFPYKYSELVILHTYPPMKMEQTECSETLAYKIQTPGNYPEESIQHIYIRL